MANGPVSTYFLTYEDFMAYSNGTYVTNFKGGDLGYHSVTILGWN
jgi:hypothetical protein